ncbi:CBO0543 family protein [Dendrosporobacter sp. 1207_IL3150]|uniref:CBO0543 family protein n=1 Tax=Dendrosporobacter sp. 1207_IL3150 TaxID=3084054 RepID=UPI002FD9AABA
MNEAESLKQILNMHALFLKLRQDHWLHYEAFTWQWWSLVFFLFAPWLLWIKIVNKKKIVEISLFGILIFVLTTGMDAIGVSYQLWNYPIKLAAKLPHMFSMDTTVFPITFMIIYQYYPTWHLYLKVTIIISAIFSFIGEPLLEYLKVYNTTGWKYIYSFPIFILIGAVCKYIVDWLILIQLKLRNTNNFYCLW